MHAPLFPDCIRPKPFITAKPNDLWTQGADTNAFMTFKIMIDNTHITNFMKNCVQLTTLDWTKKLASYNLPCCLHKRAPEINWFERQLKEPVYLVMSRQFYCWLVTTRYSQWPYLCLLSFFICTLLLLSYFYVLFGHLLHQKFEKNVWPNKVSGAVAWRRQHCSKKGFVWQIILKRAGRRKTTKRIRTS